MATKLCIRPYTIPFTIFTTPIRLFYKPYSLRTPKFVSLLSTTTATTSQYIPYGPSLLKGKTPSFDNPHNFIVMEEPRIEEEDSNSFLDENRFTRIFDIAALRVPAKDCFILESRLRGHLLNWPRIRNIARVRGDDVDDEIADLIGDEKEEEEVGEGVLDSVNRRIHGKSEGEGDKLSPVLYREKLAKSFNSRGYVNFRNLAKISRPRKKKKDGVKEGDEEERREKGRGKNDFATVELVEDEKVQEMKGLLGEEFRGETIWRGSTRLLLLDEQYSGKEVEELPEAIKAIFVEDASGNTTSSIELVRCKLTLYYSYWQMNEVLEVLLPKGIIIPTAFTTVGHIAHLNLRDEHLPYKKLIAKVVLDKNRPKIQTVVNKTDSIHNDYRTMQLEVLAGNHSLDTTVVENGLRFHFDLATVYWNSRLATERQRLMNDFNHTDVVCDVFSGVGPIAISAAKIVRRVYANDLNPYAVQYLERNSILNKVERKIEVFNMDGRMFIKTMFACQKAQHITHVVMNLPNDAAEFLDAFNGIYYDRPKGEQFTFPKVHVYGFSKARDPEFEFHERIRIALSEVAVDVEMRKVLLVAPGKWMLCASFVLPTSVAFRKRTSEM